MTPRRKLRTRDLVKRQLAQSRKRSPGTGRTGATGLAHARKTAEVTVESDTYQITVEPGITITAPRTTSRDIKRHKASNYQPG